MKQEEFEAIFQTEAGRPDMGLIEDHLHILATETELSAIALVNCAARIEESGPALRALLDKAAGGDALADDETLLLFRGLFVLGGARDPLAWPALLRLLRRPTAEIEHLLGDVITEDLSRIIIGVFDGDAGALFDAVADGAIDGFVRDALLRAATFLAWEGRIDRDLMVRFLERFHEQKLAEDWDYAWVGWVKAIALLGLRELAPLAADSFRAGRIDPQITEEGDFERDLAAAEQAPGDADRFKRDGLGYIDDILESLEKWSWTGPAEPVPRERQWPDVFQDGNVPYVNPLRHVGRNDPCPCGSGKKYKKCCLAR